MSTWTPSAPTPNEESPRTSWPSVTSSSTTPSWSRRYPETDLSRYSDAKVPTEPVGDDGRNRRQGQHQRCGSAALKVVAPTEERCGKRRGHPCDGVAENAGRAHLATRAGPSSAPPKSRRTEPRSACSIPLTFQALLAKLLANGPDQRRTILHVGGHGGGTEPAFYTCLSAMAWKRSGVRIP
jgi:hypothetical protein